MEQQQGIYKNPIFLNSVTHRSVKVAPVDSYAFAGKLNSVVIVGQEFLEAAKFYPVVFTKGQNEEIIPVALLGLRNNENLFVDAEGKWRDGAYIPAFFRRYPFILASNVGQDGSFAVCIDSSYEGFGKKKKDGITLFDEEGNQTDQFKKIIEFLRNYQAQFENTKELVKTLKEYELFRDVSANITMPAGEKRGFAGLLMVNEQKMLQLEDDKILNLVRTGYLAWVYAHLYSLSNFRTLMSIASRAGTAKG
ncbi:MAG: SapC family protein [Deltaproteobacteria bacterium]|nr:SapC family protein [Deltaproteobacteria bacterium]